MKRNNLLYVLAMAVCLSSTAAFAEELMTVKGHFRTRGEILNHSNLTTRREGVLFRIRPMMTFTPSSEVSVVFEPQAGKAFGEAATNPGAIAAAAVPTAGVNAVTSTSGNVFDPSINIHQAYANYHPNDWYSLQVGRQVLSYGDELLIGALDWHNVGRSFDAIKSHMTFGSGWLDVLWSKFTENNSSIPGGTTSTVDGMPDNYMVGFYSGWDLGSSLKEFDLYLFWLNNGASYALATAGSSMGANSQMMVAGARAKSKIDMMDYRVEGTFENGNGVINGDTTAYQIDAEFGYMFDEKSKFRFGIEGFLASRGYNQMYPTVHKWLGYADVLGRNNLLGGVAHLSANVMTDLVAKLDFHHFRRADTGFDARGIAGGALGLSAANSSAYIGNELDLVLTHNASKHVTFEGGVGYFMNGDYFTQQGVTQPFFAYLQMTTKF